ncbi:MAG: HAD family phosphatase [Clostridiales bacterium]|nr:HAD family phosphatase [Clostridiales bacterium]
MMGSQNFEKYPDLKTLSREGVKLLIFDLDGTLLDSMSVWHDVDVEFLGRYGYEVTPEYTDVVKRASIEDAARYTQEKYRIPLTWQEIQDTWESMVYDFYKSEVKLKEGAGEYVKEAKRLGFRLSVTTALSKKNANAALEATGIKDLFDCVITLEDFDGNINKGSPDVFLRASSYISATGDVITPDKAIVYDDVLQAIEGAKAGGFLTCAVYDNIGCGGPGKWESFAALCDFSVFRF